MVVFENKVFFYRETMETNLTLWKTTICYFIFV